MTHRLYYDDAYCTEFDATVTATGQDSNGLWVKLDRSAFYPTSGGQPHDTGVLTYAGGTTRVVDVAVDHGDVLHYVQQALPPGTAVNADALIGRAALTICSNTWGSTCWQLKLPGRRRDIPSACT
jgi:Ser-tRNA(Ala) deacylase AlaX